MSDTVHNPYANPQRECDLVMKGGVTSGLVYPQAVLELAHETDERPGYRFRAIGGASAGAVAAVFAAAAEFNRAGGGFSELEKVNAELQKSDGQTSFLQRLFQPQGSMRPLLSVVLRLDDYKDYAASEGMLRTVFKVLGDNGIPGLWRGAILGALAGVVVAAVLAGLIALFSPNAVFGTAWAVLGLVLALVGGALGWVYSGLSTIVSLLTVDLPRNYFGICSGMKESGATENAATEWIHESTQKIAGTSEVLTFGQLKDREVVLELMTTNISEGRPYAFPFDDPFVFCREDFDKLFPAAVVTAMVQGGERRAETFTGVKFPAGFFFMPAARDLPVTVAARMSMSFPLFFSSVPLYALPLDVRERLENEPALEYTAERSSLIPHWFSDGGIASNFPIHFFDAWLPTRPTFGITLRYLPGFLHADAASTPEERLAAEHYRKSMGIGDGAKSRPIASQIEAVENPGEPDQEHVVVLPRPQDSVPPEWAYISSPRNPQPGLDSVPNFLWAVIGSMQNYRDNLQAGLPSYRERVAQIRLAPNEGGFNLDMDEELIQRIVEKGRLAGEKLDTEYVDKHHKWVRLLVLTSELEQGFRHIRSKQTDTQFAELIGEQSSTPGYPYREDNSAVCEALRARLTALSAAMEAWAAAPPRDPFKGGSPPAVMRVTPKI